MNIATFGNFLGPDALIIFLFVLLLFGAKKLPELARGMGQAVREFSKAKDDIEREVTRPPAEEPKALAQPQDHHTADTFHDEHHQDVAHATTEHHPDVAHAPAEAPKVLAKEDTTQHPA